MLHSHLHSKETDFSIMVQTPVRWPLAVVSSPSLEVFKKKLDYACRKWSSVPPPILRFYFYESEAKVEQAHTPGPFLVLKLSS